MGRCQMWMAKNHALATVRISPSQGTPPTLRSSPDPRAGARGQAPAPLFARSAPTSPALTALRDRRARSAVNQHVQAGQEGRGKNPPASAAHPDHAAARTREEHPPDPEPAAPAALVSTRALGTHTSSSRAARANAARRNSPTPATTARCRAWWPRPPRGLTLHPLEGQAPQEDRDHEQRRDGAARARRARAVAPCYSLHGDSTSYSVPVDAQSTGPEHVLVCLTTRRRTQSGAHTLADPSLAPPLARSAGCPSPRRATYSQLHPAIDYHQEPSRDPQGLPRWIEYLQAIGGRTRPLPRKLDREAVRCRRAHFHDRTSPELDVHERGVPSREQRGR
jgi:hypothetical protein